VSTPTPGLREQGRNAMRRALLDQASQLLLEEGIHALSTRKLAELTGTSTTAIYTLFGGKDGLLEALYIEGFQRLNTAIRSVKNHKNPLEHLRAINRTYRKVALENPAYYAIMFEKISPAHEPSDTALEQAWQSMQPLIATIQRCMDAKLIPAGDAEDRAMKFWIGAHGLVSLELAGYFRHQSKLANEMHEQIVTDLTTNSTGAKPKGSPRIQK
jgi:AcrR family transcriptional regulator